MYETAYRLFQYIIYTLGSLIVVFLPLSIAIPALLEKVPFYRDAMYALDKLFKLGKEQEFSHTSEGTIKLQVGYIERGQRGFKQLLESIEANYSTDSKRTNKITLAHGDIPELDNGVCLSPNNVLLLDDDLAKRVIWFPLGSEDPSGIKTILVAWIKNRTQMVLAAYTAIAAIFWIAIGAWIWFG
jgi:hypothetical protein